MNADTVAQTSKSAVSRQRSGEHTRRRVWRSAPPPATSWHLCYFLWGAQKQSAWGPTVTREGACAPRK